MSFVDKFSTNISRYLIMTLYVEIMLICMIRFFIFLNIDNIVSVAGMHTKFVTPKFVDV